MTSLTTTPETRQQSHTHHDHDGHDHHHEPDAAGMACCTHHNVKLERYTVRLLMGAILVLATLVARYIAGSTIPKEIAEMPALIGALLLGWPLFVASWTEIRQGRASTSSLAALAVIAAIANQDFVPAGLLAFVLLVADAFVRQRAWGAERAIQDLVGLTPNTARLVGTDGTEREVDISSIQIGDTVRVRPGENLPVDGTIAVGRSTINQASLTGEAAPHEVEPGDPVYAGTTNLSSVIELTVTQVGEDTTIGRVRQLIAEAERTRTPRQLIIERVAQFFVPVTLCVAGIVWFFTRDAERAIAVLVVACPSSLLLSSPLATVAAFAAAARLGILIKKTHFLEAAGSIDTVVLDKTGTITTGKFSVSRLVPAEGVEGAELLQAAANGEQHSNHPLAKSILATAQTARIKPDGTNDFEEIHGRGIIARTSMGELAVGRASWIVERFPQIKPALQAVEARIEGMSGVHVVRDGKYLGVVGLEDKVRPNTNGVIKHLRNLGVRRVDIFTGDRISAAERVGRQVEVDTVEAECLPEEKHAQIQALTREGRRVMMVGDGINDGPSLAAADIGVAMGLGGSDIAANSAGVALMNDDLSRVPFLIELSRRTRGIIAQNIAASIIIALIGLTIAASGTLTLLLAALYHLVGDVFVIGNSFRLFRFGEAFTEGEAAMREQAAEAAAHARATSPRAGRIVVAGA